MSFLSAKAHPSPGLAILGAPYDATSTFRGGSRYGPEAIRWASQSIESYSPVLQRDLDDMPFSDLGDVDTDGLPPEGVVEAVRSRIVALAPTTIPVLLGGEHTITLGAVRALRLRHRNLAVLQLDAHTDLRDSYEGRRVSHATVMRRVLEEVGNGAVVQLGVRAGTREEFHLAETVLRYSSSRLAIPPAVWTWLEDRRVYLTVDVDVIDPAEAPGAGNPEPEGVSGRELLAFVRRLSMLRVVGLDLVEVAPPYDPSGRTAVLAATIVREAILAISAPTPV